MLATDDDRAHVDAVIAGDRAAIGRLVRRYTRVVYWIARRDTRLGPEDADDVTQRVFIKLLDDGARRLREWRGEAFEPFLRQVARNEAISFARENIRAGHDSIDDAELPERLSTDADVEGEVLLTEVRAFIVECFEFLSPAEQRAVIFRYQDELDQRSIAAMLGMTQSGAAQRVSRATRVLRTCLAAKLGPAPWVLA